MRRARSVLLIVLAAWLLVLGAAGGAQAVDGEISYVESTGDAMQIVLSVPAEAEVDLTDVRVTIADQAVDATAEPAGDDTTVRRTSILAIDTSESMAGDRFDAARLAAQTYLDTLPDDVYVGVVGFDSDVTAVVEPTQDREATLREIAALSLNRQTRLYDAVTAALALAGEEGQRNVLVLSDGADTGDTPLAKVTTALRDSDVQLDVVALEQSGGSVDALGRLASAGGGEVIASDSDALGATFSEEADVLASQVLVTAEMPDGLSGSSAPVAVRLASSAGDITASAVAQVTTAGVAPVATETFPGLQAPESSSLGIDTPPWALYAGIGVFGVGLLVALAMLVPAKPVPMSAADRVTTYSRVGAGGPIEEKSESEPALAQATQAMAGVLERNRGLDARISHRLDGAGSEMKSSEWLLLQSAVLVLSGLIGLLVGQGNLIVGLAFMLVGALGPWLFLGIRRSRRRKRFNSLLPETLQMMSGSLSAGLSLGQSVDTIVREGSDPVSSEFKRVLVETRLGVSLEDAFDGVAARFDSKDFEWVVMAIRIQREVGGNLAELLDTVAATMREREYMRRQVNALAAEGKLSAYVLGGLPPAFLLYLLVAQGDYVSVLFTDIRGIFMLVGAAFWLGVGVFWMNKLIKVEV